MMELLKYPTLKQGRFCRRLNRFLAEVELDGAVERCHVKNTGRLRELLLPDAEVWCECHDDPNRKTKFSLLLVRSGEELVSIDSQAPNKVAFSYVQDGGLGFVPDSLRREVTRGDSRFDLCCTHDGQTMYIEVKGVTLKKDGLAMFPDAPTERGAKHVRGLLQAVREGCEACILFVIQRSDVREFKPNEGSDPAFAAALREAAEGGVRVQAVSCEITTEGMKTAAPVTVRL